MERSARAPTGSRLIFLFPWFFHCMQTSVYLSHLRVSFLKRIMAGPGTFEYLEKLMAVESQHMEAEIFIGITFFFFFFFYLHVQNCIFFSITQGFSRVKYTQGEVAEFICAYEERLIQSKIREGMFTPEEIQQGIL